MKIYLGADHRGFKLKEEIKKFLSDQYSIEDLGNEVLNEDDDFTDYAKRVGGVISTSPEDRGILFCGGGAGVTIAANKFDGVRASLGLNPEQVKNSRADDDINILAIAADFTDFEIAKIMVELFLKTEFTPSEKHLRRIEDIKKLEN